ncbi:MAG: hypothetical protein LC723_14340 [Actinobacteria bacterium]|nr:hypothetical protein [Actinomycetota bacterium]
MADISSLGNIVSAEPVDLSGLVPAGPGFPRAGRYVLQVPEDLGFEGTFSTTKAGHLSAEINPVIVGPTGEGFKVRFVKMSAKTYERKGKSTSQIAEFLAACGVRGTLTGDPSQTVDAVLSTAGRRFEAQLDWRAWNKATQTETEGMENFPQDGAGNYLPYVLDETNLDENGKPTRIRANINVRYFVSAR